MKKIKYLVLAGLALLLSGCKAVMLDPKGIIAAAEKKILIDSTLLMLLVVVPVIVMAFTFAYRYRVKAKAKYTPNWSHSTALEVVLWTIPCAIVVVLATITWISSHKLDPYRPLAVKKKPIIIQAVALDWKWLFIYPKQGIATVNIVQFPINTPVRFLITADAAMNAFAIPQLAGQIYAMPGMTSQLNLLATSKGDYRGQSVNFSGEGFSNMHFVARVSSKKQFNLWVQKVKHSPRSLSDAAYAKLARPTEKNDVTFYSSAAKGLFRTIINKYLKPSKSETGAVKTASKGKTR